MIDDDPDNLIIEVRRFLYKGQNRSKMTLVDIEREDCSSKDKEYYHEHTQKENDCVRDEVHRL